MSKAETKTKRNYNWELPIIFNPIWKNFQQLPEDAQRLKYDDLYRDYNTYLDKLGIDAKYTMKSIRKCVATKEFASIAIRAYLKEGGQAL